MATLAAIQSAVPDTKECRVCHQVKSADEFCRSKSKRDGLHYCCRPCGRAHAQAWYLANKTRAAAAMAVWRRNNPDKIREMGRRWSKKNPEKKRATAAAYRARHPDRLRAKWLRQYGITNSDYDAMLSAQGGVCAICHEAETGMRRGKPLRLAVDHAHDSGRVRGLLCGKCNKAIGLLGDNPQILLRVMAYLEKSR